MRSLDEYEKSELETKLKKSKDLSERKRIFAMIGYDDGQSIEELADLRPVSTQTVGSYLRGCLKIFKQPSQLSIQVPLQPNESVARDIHPQQGLWSAMDRAFLTYRVFSSISILNISWMDVYCE